VFAKYFAKQPPFSEHRDKKAEFPNAFVIESLIEFCTQNDTHLMPVNTWSRKKIVRCTILFQPINQNEENMNGDNV